jgi:peptidoglycan hydrolase-like protein with peptidoglycan-binding domain
MKLSRTLTLNMSGEDVAFMQTRLKDIGFFNSKISGYFGQDTLIAVTNFQKEIGMKPNGKVGFLMWSKLKSYGITTEPEVHEVSYTTPNGLTIYDNLISDDSYYNDIVKKDTIWLHNSEGSSRPDWTINGWKKEYLKDVSGKFIIDSNRNPIQIKVGKAYLIGRK